MTQTGWMKDFIDWLGDRPAWLQHAAEALASSRSLSDEQLHELYHLCLKEAADPSSVSGVSLAGLAFSSPSGRTVRLLTIGDVTGLNALNPRSPLQVGQAPLTVVYGENGTGKSGYVRILKQVCGSRDRAPIRANVFERAPSAQRCCITYEVDGTPTTVSWSPSDGPIEDLREVDIFDTRLGRIVLTEENEVTYEPPVLTFISDLVAVCQYVRSQAEAEIRGTRSELLPLPQPVYRGTTAGAWYESLSAGTTDSDIEAACHWEQSDAEELDVLTRRLSATSPADVAAALRRRAQNLDSLLSQIIAWEATVTAARCEAVRELRRRATTARAAADLAAEEAFSGVPMEGVGSEAWRSLWEYARTYSERHAYPGEDFPVTSDGSRCVLCMQELDEVARQRVQSFEEFVRGAAEAAAERAEADLRQATEDLGTPPSNDDVLALLDTGSVEDADERQVVVDFFAEVRDRFAWAMAAEAGGELGPLKDLSAYKKQLGERAERLRTNSDAFDQDARSADRSAITRQRDELIARQWVATQAETIRREVSRLGRLEILQKAQSLSATTGLSSKKGTLAEQLVSEAFIRRFADELRSLAADRIRVELLKTRTERGHTLHRVQLRGLERTSIGEILSEGEFRVVALAATLADASIGEAQGAFVFDDPISSLDQRYEEAVVQRLVDLARRRQVIIFTHRLSLIGLVDEYSQKANISQDLLCVAREPWGTGQPIDAPLATNKPDGALRRLRDERLAKAAKALREEGSDAYLPLAKGICSDYRILIERVIEFVLLADVVQRHRRQVKTLNKLDKVAKVELSDCELLDRLMTKYSRYEHSQSAEAPVALPEPDELESDINEALDWIEGFRKR